MVKVTDSIGIDGEDRNWTVQRWHAPRALTAGFLAGQTSKGHWEVMGYYRDLGDALKKALDEVVKDNVMTGEVTTLVELATAVDRARAACVAAKEASDETGD